MNGHCLCGKTQFEVEILNKNIHACHCAMCRRQVGGILMSVDIKPSTLIFKNPKYVGIFDSSEWGERGFCKACGTSLFWRLKNNEYANVNIFALDCSIEEFNLHTEIYIDHKPNFYALKNKTIQLTESDVLALVQSSLTK